jgi:hypothetical protein
MALVDLRAVTVLVVVPNLEGTIITEFLVRWDLAVVAASSQPSVPQEILKSLLLLDIMNVDVTENVSLL